MNAPLLKWPPAFSYIQFSGIVIDENSFTWRCIFALILAGCYGYDGHWAVSNTLKILTFNVVKLKWRNHFREL